MTKLRPAMQGALLMLITASVAVPLSVSPVEAASQYVVLSAEPPSEDLALGKVFVPSDVINVPAGTTVTLLGEDGSVNEISGPGAFIVTSDPDSLKQSSDIADRLSKLRLVAGFLANERQRTESIGGSRSTADQGTKSELDNPWAISIEEPAPGCIKNRELVLVRQRFGERLVFSIRFDETDPLNDLVWTAGKATYALPEPLTGEAKALTVETSSKPVRIEIRIMPADLDNPLDILGWMVRSGCDRQAVAFTRQLAKAKN